MRHTHPSVRALLDAEGSDDPVAAIRRRARALVAEALELGWDGPPFDMGELASLCGLKIASSRHLRADQDACVTPGQILLNAAKPPVRQRYSAAHEIGHTLFPDYEDTVRRAGRLWRRHGDDSEFEQLCQVAGSELLFPLGAFLAAVAARGPGLLGVLDVADAFRASPEATARRHVETSPEPMAVVFLRPQDPDTGGWFEPGPSDGHAPFATLGVSLVCAHAACGAGALPRACCPPKGSAADLAWKRVSLARGRVVVEQTRGECWAHAGVEGRWDGEALTLPIRSRTPREVLCLMRPATA